MEDHHHHHHAIPEPKFSFEDFIAFFPEVELPISISEDSLTEYSKNNRPLPHPMIDRYLATDNDDEYTEYIPCFRIPKTKDFTGIVYWKAGLMDYQFILTTYHNDGTAIDTNTIAGTTVLHGQVIRSAATLDQDWIIFTAVGREEGDVYDATTTRLSTMELLPNGMIIVSS